MDLGTPLVEECSNSKRKSLEISSVALLFVFLAKVVIENGDVFGTVGQIISIFLQNALFCPSVLSFIPLWAGPSQH